MDSMKKKLGIFIQARMGSTRLPGKVLKNIGGKSALKIMIDNLKKTEYSDSIFILTSDKKEDDKIERFCREEKVICFRGSEEDVLDRFFKASEKYNIKYVVRLTADCPFLSMTVLKDSIVDYFENGKFDYLSAIDYPIGLGDVEITNFVSLSKAYGESTKKYHREHVLTYLKDHPEKFRVFFKEAPGKYNRTDIRLTLDEQKDLELLQIVYKKNNGRIDLDSIIDLFNKEPDLLLVNRHVKQKTV